MNTSTANKPVVFVTSTAANKSPTRLTRTKKLLEILSSTSDLIPLIQAQPTVILDRLSADQERIAVFHFDGRSNHFNSLLDASKKHPIGDLFAFLGKLPHLRLVILAGCSTPEIADPLAQAGVRVILSSSRRIEYEPLADYLEIFYQDLLNGFSFKEAESDAFEEAEIEVRTHKPKSEQGRYWLGLIAEEQEKEKTPWAKPQAGQAADTSPPQTATDTATDAFIPPHVVGKYDLPKELSFPQEPFKRLVPFQYEDGHNFFGRDEDSTKLCDLVVEDKTTSLLIVYGAPGVGTTSLLSAGLRPLLTTLKWHSHLLDCRKRESLYEQARHFLKVSEAKCNLVHAWRYQEIERKGPILLIIDHVESCFADVQGRAKLNELSTLLQAMHAAPILHLQGKLLLCVKTETASMLSTLVERYLPIYRQAAISRLTEKKVTAILTETIQAAGQNGYHVTMDAEVAGPMVTELFKENPASPIAPFVQLMLWLLWQQLASLRPAERVITQKRYQEACGDGRLGKAFLKEQLARLRIDWPHEVDSGLVLDMLYQHTTPDNLPNERTPAELYTHYRHCENFAQLIQALKRLCLLVDCQPNPHDKTCLADRTLIPVVREQFALSDATGQRARRIVESRVSHNAVDAFLSRTNLQTAEQGYTAMRRRTADEENLVLKSREATQVLRYRTPFLISAVLCLLLLSALLRPDWWVAFDGPIRWLERLSTANLAAAKNQIQPNSTITESVLVPRNDDPSNDPPVEPPRCELAGETTYQMTFPSAQYGQPLRAMAFAPGGSPIVSADALGVIRFWDVATRSELRVFESGLEEIDLITFSPNGVQLMAAGTSGEIHLWNTLLGTVQHTLLGHNGRVTAAHFSQDGNQIVSGGADGTLRVWDALTGAPLFTFLDHVGGGKIGVSALALTSEGRQVASGGIDGEMHLWNLQSDQQPIHLPGTGVPIQALAYGSNQQRLFAAGSDGIITVWNLSTQQAEKQLKAHTATINSLQLHPNRPLALSASDDQSIRLWDLNQGRELCVLRGYSDWVSQARFSPDGRLIASASWDGSLRLWELLSD